MKILPIVLILTLACLALAQTQIQDRWPGGCSDCHVLTEERDLRITPLSIAVSPGPHQNLDPDATVEACMPCHQDPRQPWAFTRIMHTSHLESEIFSQRYEATCNACHGMTEDGWIFVKGLPEPGG